MAKKGLFSGAVFLGFGFYFLLKQYDVAFFKPFLNWPTLLVIVGLGFLLQGYIKGEHAAILPGTVIAGIGLHFHIIEQLDSWQDPAGVFLLLISIGLLLTYVKSGEGIAAGLIFLSASAIVLFFDRIVDWASAEGLDVSLLDRFWPFLYLAAGAYFIILQRKK